MTVRSVGLFGAVPTRSRKCSALRSPVVAATDLRAEEQRRIRDLRSLVITSVNNQPVRVEDVVEGGRASTGDIGPARRRRQPSDALRPHRLLEGRTRTARRARRRAHRGSQVGHDEPDVVECIVLLRKNEADSALLKDVIAKVAELNDPNRGGCCPASTSKPITTAATCLSSPPKPFGRTCSWAWAW